MDGIAGGSRSDYSPKALALVKATCLSVAQILGDDHMSRSVIVGGLVPSLLYAETIPSPQIGAHVGTTDVDLTLDIAILDEARYEDIATRLNRATFSPSQKENGNIVRQTWTRPDGAKVDFLMPPIPPDTMGGSLQHLTADLAASTMRGLDLALSTSLRIDLRGQDLDRNQTVRSIPICAPQVFIILKALAMRQRAKNKDAYDLYYVLRHDVDRPSQLAGKLANERMHPAVVSGIASIEAEFEGVDSRGPRDVARFLGQSNDDNLLADVYANAQNFLDGFRHLGEHGGIV